MPYRARANGNVLGSVPPSLVGVLYDEIPEGDSVQKPEPPRVRFLAKDDGWVDGPIRPVVGLETMDVQVPEPPKRRRGRPRKNPLPTE